MHPNTLDTAPTSSIARHYPKCREYKRSIEQPSQSQSTLISFMRSAPKSRERADELTKAIIEDEILKFFISGNIPFAQVENEHFRKLISFIEIGNRCMEAPSRKVIRKRLCSKAELARDNLRTVIAANSSRISLALDCWSTRTNYGFLGMNPHHVRQLT